MSLMRSGRMILPTGRHSARYKFVHCINGYHVPKCLFGEAVRYDSHLKKKYK